MKKSLRDAVLVLIVLATLISLVACVRPEYTVTFVLGDGREDVVTTVQSGTKLYTPEPTDDSLVFAGWYLDSELNTPFLTSKLTSDMTLYARFIKKGESTVTFVYNDNGATPDTTVVFSGTLPEPKEPVREGYTFVGWRDGETGEYFNFGAEPDTSHTTLTAVWLAAVTRPTLTVDYNDGTTAPKSYDYRYNAKPEKPKTPTRRGYVFYGWFTDPELTTAFDFSKPLTKDVTIYAGWVMDISGVANRVADEVLISTVEVYVEHKKTQGPFNTQIVSATGSGVIYKATTNRYYVLTNHHVIEDQGYTTTDYYVRDAYGNEYAATLHAYSASYDLALLSFAKSDTVLSVATLAATNPEIGQLIVSIGCPGGLNNSVTYGEMLRYQPANVEGGAVTFDVGWHDAPMALGSSGGGVFNSELQLVGINFAASVDDDNNFLYGAFIQIERVLEFITDVESKYVLT